VHFFRLLAVRWPSAQSARDNHVLACNFAKYLPSILKVAYAGVEVNRKEGKEELSVICVEVMV